MVGHVAPEAAAGGPIAAVREGDTIHIDIANRQSIWKFPKALCASGCLNGKRRSRATGRACSPNTWR